VVGPLPTFFIDFIIKSSQTCGIMKTKYVTIDVSTVAGHDKAERLVRRGWKIYRGGLFYVTLKSK
jgi:hypothetical protein